MGQIKDIGALVRQYLFETPAAACLTLATMIFIISGAAYERALRNPQTSVRALVRLADILSGIAAILLTAALAHFGDTYLALLAGGMLAIGKTGSALVPETSDETRSRARLTWLFRMIVVVSRIPSIAGLAVSLWRLHDTGGTAADARMAALMLLCYVITLAADLLLIRHGQRKAG